MKLPNRIFLLFIFLLMRPLGALAQCSPMVYGPLSPASAITSFVIGSSTGIINETTRIIAVTVPSDTDVATLVPTIEVSENATVDPASGAMNDFTVPATYTVTAQDGTTRQAYVVTVTKLPKKEKGRSGTYLKFGLAHWQEDIFSQDLTQWQGNIFSSNYNLTSLNIEIETYFKKNHVLLSGWSIGYRKDDLRYIDTGHMFYGKTFRNFDLKLFEVKTGGGIEWGMPSLSFDKTVFDYRTDGSIRYRHTYPKKNANVPGIGTTKDGAFYPFGELSFAERRGAFLVEGGMRINVIRFGIDNYEIVNNRIRYDFNDRPMMAPYLFLNIGIKTP